MTTVITRLYDGAGTAETVAQELMGRGFPESIISVIADGPGAEKSMHHARVGAAASAAYAAKLNARRSMLVVRAPFNPVGAARTAMDVADSRSSVNVGLDNENVYLRETPDRRHFLSVLTDHPRFFSSDMVPGSGRYRNRVSSAFGLRLLSHKPRRNKVISGGKRIFPMNTISRKSRNLSVIRGGRLMSEGIFLPTLTMHKPS